MGDHDDHDPNKNHLSSNLEILAIVVLFVIIISVFVYCLHDTCVYWCCRVRRHSSTNGLNPSVIASLPLFQFKRNNDNNQEQDNNTVTDCVICLYALEDGEMARSLPNCNHIFHAECIDRWFNQDNTCPICRTPATPWPAPQAVPTEAPTFYTPTSPPLQRTNSSSLRMEGTSDMGSSVQQSGKIGGPSSLRLSSFRRVLSRERSNSY